MQIDVKSDGEDRYVISCPNEMEWRARINLVQALQDATDGLSVRGVILDLEGVQYMNSAALGAIFALRNFLKQGSIGIVISRPSATVTRLLSTINMTQLMPVTDTLDDARRRLLEASAGGCA